jgi:large subunit ribosomal protein L4
MATLPLHDPSGTRIGEMAVSAALFAAAPHRAVLHRALVAAQAAMRQGTHKAKTRSEVAGSTRKLRRQKGTGRARVGDARPPHYTGGGVAMGPVPRSHRQVFSRQVRAAALRSALSAQAEAGEVALIEPFELAEKKTKSLQALLEAMEARGRVLMVVGQHDPELLRCGRNIPELVIATAGDLTTRQVLGARKLIIATDALPTLEARLA